MDEGRDARHEGRHRHREGVDEEADGDLEAVRAEPVEEVLGVLACLGLSGERPAKTITVTTKEPDDHRRREPAREGVAETTAEEAEQGEARERQQWDEEDQREHDLSPSARGRHPRSPRAAGGRWRR